MNSTRAGKPVLLVFLLSCLLMIGISQIVLPAQQDLEIIELRAENAAKLIAQDKGRVVVVLIYGAYCPACRRFFPSFLEFAGDYLDRDLDVLALSVDDTKEEIHDYLRGYELTIVPIWLIPYGPGELTKALASVGIKYGQYVPFVAVLDKKGRVVYEGNASIQHLTRAVEASLR